MAAKNKLALIDFAKRKKVEVQLVPLGNPTGNF